MRTALTALLLAAVALPAWSDDPASAFDDAELERLVAPVALYPDDLLTQILIAATYPLEVVAAARFVRAHPDLEGAEAVRAAAGQGWDSSVQTLVAFPEVLERMNAELDWTRRIGEAFLLQEADLMLAVQTLRQRARRAGTLTRPEHLTVAEADGELLLGRPREDLVYIPWYDTRSAYGRWPHAQPPVHWDPVAWHHSGRHSSSAFLWAPGVGFGATSFPSRVDWGSRQVVVIHGGAQTRWRHDPKHRRGARFHHPDAKRRFEHRRDRGRETARRPDRRQRPAASWPEAPTASLSQQRAGAIDTRTATERLRALQQEAARESTGDRPRQRTHRSPPPRRLEGVTRPANTVRAGPDARRTDARRTDTAWRNRTVRQDGQVRSGPRAGGSRAGGPRAGGPRTGEARGPVRHARPGSASQRSSSPRQTRPPRRPD